MVKDVYLKMLTYSIRTYIRPYNTYIYSAKTIYVVPLQQRLSWTRRLCLASRETQHDCLFLLAHYLTHLQWVCSYDTYYRGQSLFAIAM